ncbi:MAG TPA: cupredoxin domain-containing protein [Thermoanaerobaculia bacterium]
MIELASVLWLWLAQPDVPRAAEVASGRLAREHTIMVSNGPPFYAPATVTVRVGETVHWRSGVHSDTHGVREALHGTFSLEIPPGGEVTHQFQRPGEYPYRCRFHPWMVGKIVVEPRKLEVRWTSSSEFLGSSEVLGGEARTTPRVPSEEPRGTPRSSEEPGVRWLIDRAHNKILRRDEGGAIVEFSVPSSLGAPKALAPVDGGVWILTEDGRLAQLVDGRIDEYAVSLPLRGVAGLAMGENGELWLLDGEGHRIGQVSVEVRTLARLR